MMGKSRPQPNGKDARSRRLSKKNPDKVLSARLRSKKSSQPKESVEELLAKGSVLLQTSQPDEALSCASRALSNLRSEDAHSTARALPTLLLLAEIQLELGDADAARNAFVQAVHLDPRGLIDDSLGGGAEKFLWLAQLSEEGGHDSVSWFEKGITVLRNDLASKRDREVQAQKRRKLAAALCGVVEIYMTDLSWEPDAESRCESLITEAMLVAPESPETLQTLANVRISQTRVEEARKVLADSIELWKDLPAGDDSVPEFPARISLSRLLMEVEMEDDAMGVLERLVEEDDTSVEVWYLGGWCMYLTAERRSPKKDTNWKASDDVEEGIRKASLISSRDWLINSLRLYELQDYEDERLRDHARELVRDLNSVLGDNQEDPSDEDDDAEEEGWHSDGDDEDQAMEGT
ncbi:MAG: hypothetical protein Q9197_006875 [Variospora fuerteventurae]